MKVFLVTSGTRHVLVNIPDGLVGDEREFVKREANRFLFGNPDYYTVNPLTNHGDVVFLSLSIGLIEDPRRAYLSRQSKTIIEEEREGWPQS